MTDNDPEQIDDVLNALVIANHELGDAIHSATDLKADLGFGDQDELRKEISNARALLDDAAEDVRELD